MKKVAVLIALAVLLVVIVSAMGYEIYNMPNFNVSTVPGELIINGSIDVVHYEESLHKIERIIAPTPEDIVISSSFNLIVLPLEYGFDDMINKTIISTIVTVSPPDYTFSERICVDEGKYFIILANPGRDWGGFIYEGIYDIDIDSCVGVEGFWPELNEQYDFTTMTSTEIMLMIENRVQNSTFYSDNFLFVFDPPVEAKPLPTPEPTLQPTPIPTPVSTPSLTPTPQSTPTPEQPGFEMIFVIVTLLITHLCLRRRK